jgi:hypothetical protein
MVQEKSKTKDLSTGDLVTHVLYGKEWIGMIISFKETPGKAGGHKEKALVQIQPGTKYDGFFRSRASKLNRVGPNLGFISINWLFKMEEKKWKS